MTRREGKEGYSVRFSWESWTDGGRGCKDCMDGVGDCFRLDERNRLSIQLMLV